MPTYAYRCVSCGQTFEVFQPISAAPLETCMETVCPSASDKGRGKVERLISGGAGLIFNGNGFYITDYKRTAQSSAEKNTKESTGSCSSGTCACSTSE
jgi:putative FmdB family regulatory protein